MRANIPPDAKTSRAAALAALLFLMAFAGLSIWLARPPAARPADSPPTEFSSGRAMAHVREVARAPHPTGTLEHARARAYILGELRRAGVEPEIQSAEVVPEQLGSDRPSTAARVQNIVARVRGTSGGRALMLAAHYDSVPTAPGATDDGAGVATLLETLRALKAGPPLRNDLILLFTDAEELGLIGAQAFAEQHPWMKDVALVLNFEGRGAGGPSMMFETSKGNGVLVRELARAVPGVVANSLMYSVYERMPNDTDMTVFKGAGAAGLNFAYAARITHYHTMLDSAEELDERSLQHHGTYALALARGFGNSDLTQLRARDYVYFNAFGPLFVRYSSAWVMPLTAVVTALFILVAWLGRRAGRLSLKGVAAGFGAFLIASLCAAGASAGAWLVAQRLHEGYAYLPWDTPYSLWPYELGFVLLSLSVVAAVYAYMFRRTGAADLLFGALVWWLLCLLATTALLPLATYVFAWPLLFMLIGAALLFRRGARLEGSGGLLLLAACAVPCVVIFAPLASMFFMMLGLELVGPFMLLVALAASMLVPHLRALTAGMLWPLPTTFALAGLCFLAAGVAASGFDARHRKANTLLYFLDADAGSARWVSADAQPDDWTSQFLSTDVKRERLSVVFPWVRSQGWQAAAEPLPLPAPRVEVLEDRTSGDTRTTRLRVASQRSAPMLLVYADASSDIRRALVNGRTLLANTAGDSKTVMRFSYAAPPPEGLELLLESGATSPLRLTVQDLSYSLPEIPGSNFKPRPEHMMPAPSYRASDTTVVSRAVSF